MRKPDLNEETAGLLDRAVEHALSDKRIIEMMVSALDLYGLTVIRRPDDAHKFVHWVPGEELKTGPQVHIDWLQDSHDCETCGSSWAEGAIVTIDGQEVLNLTPSASCFDDTSYTSSQVFEAIIRVLGIRLTQSTADELGEDE